MAGLDPVGKPPEAVSAEFPVLAGLEEEVR